MNALESRQFDAKKVSLFNKILRIVNKKYKDRSRVNDDDAKMDPSLNWQGPHFLVNTAKPKLN